MAWWWLCSEIIVALQRLCRGFITAFSSLILLFGDLFSAADFIENAPSAMQKTLHDITFFYFFSLWLCRGQIFS